MTPEGWRASSYGEVFVERVERGESRAHLPVLSVTKSRGPMLASERFGKPLHGKDLAKYRVAYRNDVVADPMLLWDGSIGIQRVVDAGLVSPDYRVYVPAPNGAAEFLAYLVRSPGMLAHYQGGARGTNVRRNRIARSDFLRIPFALPPLGEQRKIAAILSSVDDAIEATQAVIDQLQVVKKAMMAELLTRGVPGRHTRFKMTEIGEVPESWDVVRLGDAADVVRGSTPRPARDPRFFGGNAVPWITVGELSKEDWPYLSETATGLTEEGKARSRFLERGTLVLSNSGFGCGVPKILQLDGCANDGIAAFLKLQRFRPLFLYYVLASLTEHLRGSVARGVEQPNLNTTLIGDLRIVAPSEREQAEISDVLFGLDERVARERATMKAGRDLKVALTRVLLTGEVRVKPDEGAA